MPQRIESALRESGQPVPSDRAGIVRCILDSLAQGYAQTLAEASEVAERQVTSVHVVGGGSQNDVLCQLTADMTGTRVVSGPV